MSTKSILSICGFLLVTMIDVIAITSMSNETAATIVIFITGIWIIAMVTLAYAEHGTNAKMKENEMCRMKKEDK